MTASSMLYWSWTCGERVSCEFYTLLFRVRISAGLRSWVVSDLASNYGTLYGSISQVGLMTTVLKTVGPKGRGGSSPSASALDIVP